MSWIDCVLKNRASAIVAWAKCNARAKSLAFSVLVVIVSLLGSLAIAAGGGAGAGAAGAAGAAEAVEVLSFDQAAPRLRQGGYVLMMRHAQTVAGVGDPPGFKVDDCATQRNLSDVGRQQARDIGMQMAKAGIRLDAIRTSQWCRCRETARLAFGERVRDIADWPELNSFRGQRESVAPERTRAVNAFARTLPAIQNIMLVTHQVNITAISGGWVESAEILAFLYEDGALRVRFRIKPL